MFERSSGSSGKVSNEGVPTVLPRAPWLILFAVLAAALLAGSYACYRVETERVSREKYEEISAIAKIKAEHIRQWRLDRLGDVQSLVRGPVFRNAVSEWLASPHREGLREQILERLTVEAELEGCPNVILVSTDAQILLTAKPLSGPLEPAEKQAIADAVTNRSATLSRLYRSPQGTVLLDGVAPFESPSLKTIAVAVFRFSAETVLYPLIQSWPTSSKTAETLLVRREGEGVLFLNELRHRADAALALQLPLSQGDLPAVQAVLGKTGRFLGKDYRGQEVLADLRSIPDSPWFMVAKVDTSEILKEVRYRGWVTALFCGVSILFAAAVVGFAYRQRQAELYRGLYLTEQMQRQAEEVFRTTLYSIGDAVITTDLGGLVQHMNPVAEQLTGWMQHEARGKPVDTVFHIINEETRERVQNPVDRVLRDKTIVGLANHTVLLAKDGTERPIADSGSPILDERRVTMGVVLVFRDQTAERQSRKELEESEERYRTVADHTYDWEYWTGPDERLRYCSPSCERVTGYRADAFLNDHFLLKRIVHPEDAWIWEQHHANLTSGSEECILDYRIVHRNGHIVWISHYCSPVYSAEGIYLGRRVSNRDFTDRKIVEEALAASKGKLEAALASMTDAVFISDIDGNFVDFNEAFVTFHKFGNREECGKTLAEYPIFLDVYLPNGELAGLEQWAVPRALRGETATNTEYTLRRKDTGETWVGSYSFAPIRDREGAIVGSVVVGRDITEKKKAEEALKLSEARRRVALDAAHAGAWEWDLQTNQNFWSDEVWDLYGLEPNSCQPSYASWLGAVHPDDREDAARAVKEAASRGAELEAEWRTNHVNGNVRWLMSRGRPVFNAEGRALRYIGIVMDITDRKRAEQIIRDSEKNHRLLIENLHAGILVHGPDTRVMLCNRVAATMLGLSPGELIGKTLSDRAWNFLREDGSPMPVDEYPVTQVRATREPLDNLLIGLNRPHTNERAWGLVNAYPSFNEDHELEQIVVIFLDITDLKRAEESLRKSEKRYRRLHESMRDAFVQVDMAGTIVDCNRAYQEMLGYTAEELHQLTYMDLTPEKWHEFEARIVSEDILPLGRSAVYEKEYKRKDGAIFPVELRTSLITDDDGKPSGMWAIVRDITDRKREQISLTERERKFRLLYEEAPVPYQSVDEAGNLLEVNVAWLQLLGYSRDEVLGKSFADFLTPQSKERFAGTFQEFKQVGYVNAVEHEMVCKDGSAIDVSIDGRIAWSEEGKFRHTHCVLQDITQRKRAEQAVLDSEQRYRAIFNTASVGIDLLDRHGRFLEVNSTLCHFLGYTPEEFRNLSIIDITHPEDLNESVDLYDDLVHGRTEGYRLEKRYVRKDGAVVWGNTAVSSIRDADGNYKATVGVIRDITQYRASEEARIRLEAAVEHAAEAVEITDPRATIVYVNPSFEKTTGYSREEAVGKNPRILKSDQHDESFYREMWNTISKGNIWKGHFINRKKDGTLFEEDVSISPVKNDSGEIVNYVAVKRDVTREVSLQGQLLQAQKMEAIGTMAGGIAHDFNNILQVGLGFSELILGDENLPSRFRTDLLKIYESSKRGADLVQRLLTFSRKTEMKPQPINLNRRIVELRKMLERTIPKMIDIQLCLGENLATINADPTQIDQVLMNLSVNARDAMPEGGRLVIETQTVFLDEEYANAYLEAKSGHHVLLSLTDTGAGMNRDTLQHIFEPFYTTKAVGEGTGLGLAMVHGIVRNHGGHIRCFSEPGHGTTFKIYLPALVSREDEEQTHIEAIPRGGAETVLLVDDEEMIRDLGARILSKSGYTVLTACNGREAIDLYLANAKKIAVVVLDLIMPEMGGKQCLEELLVIDPSVNVVIASGYSANGPARDSLSSGAKGFVNKPYDLRQMLRVIREVLDRDRKADV